MVDKKKVAEISEEQFNKNHTPEPQFIEVVDTARKSVSSDLDSARTSEADLKSTLNQILTPGQLQILQNKNLI